MTDRNALLESALAYARRGWPVFPCIPRDKNPMTEHGFKDATTDARVIRGWWHDWPDANVAIVTGDVSGLLAVDVDIDRGGVETLRELEAQYAPLPETVQSLTGSGGWHNLYHCPPGLPCGRLGVGIDIKANGGYIVAPPSIHPSGRAYAWEAAHHPDDIPIAEPPGWLLYLLTQRKQTTSTQPAEARIPEGERNSRLTSLAGAMRRQGADETAIFAAIWQHNISYCDPPLDEREVRRIAHSVARYQPSPDHESLQRDYGHAAVLAELFKDRYRWGVERGRWFAWTGQVWRFVPEEAVAKQAAEELRQHYAAQLAVATEKAAIQELAKKTAETCTYARITGALSFLKGWPGILTMQAEWDSDPWLLNVCNGALDLKTAQLRPHNPADLCTKLAPVDYDPTADDTLWRRHIERFLPNENVRRQVQRDMGASLPGAVLQEVLPIWYGGGANGKTTTSRVFLEVLGDYADRAAPNLLVLSKYERHPTELAELCGLRLVVSVEVDRGKHLAEALVKELTGGDRKKARFMRQDFFSFSQTFSILLIVNHKPIVSGTDDGIWRRIRLVPWEYRIPESEKRPQDEVISELVSHGSAVLNWLLAGLQDWQADPRWVADEVRAASDAYRAEMDILGEFIADRCVLGPRLLVSKSELYDSYVTWCTGTAERPVSKREFTRLLESRGIGEGRTGHDRTRCYVGIGLKVTETWLRTNADSVSVSAYSETKIGGYTENVSASVRNMSPLGVGTYAWLLDACGAAQNAEPWRIVDVVDGPDGAAYAMFAERPTGWPLERCIVACPDFSW